MASVTVNAGGGPDTLLSDTSVPVVFNGGTGDDKLRAGSVIGPDTFVGGSGTDRVDYSARTSSVIVSPTGGAANDGASGELDDIRTDVEEIYGSQANDVLYGGSSVPAVLRAGNGDDLLFGGSAGAVLDGGLGSDDLYSGSANDTADYSQRTDAVVIDQTGGRSGSLTDAGEYDTVDAAIKTIKGSANTQTNAARGRYIDGAGNHTYIGLGPTHVTDGPGNDTYKLGVGSDFVDDGAGNDTYDGGAGDDQFNDNPAAEADVYAGGTGNDFVEYWAKGAGVTVTLDGVANDGLVSEGDNVGTDVEKIGGSNYDDSLTANERNNELYGRGGDDTLVGGLGSDVVNGDGGDDSVSYAASPSAVSFRRDGDVLVGGANNENERVRDVETWYLSKYDDTFDDPTGSTAVWVSGGTGDDVLTTGTAGDTILAGSGADVVSSGAGDDLISASDSGTRDRLSCGDGADTVGADTADQDDLTCELGQLALNAGAATPAAVPLTSDAWGAPTDWIHWPSATAATVDRRAGTAVLSTWTTTSGSPAPTVVTGSSTFSWTDAAGTPPLASSAAGVSTGGSGGNGYRVRVPLAPSSTSSNVRLYVGAINGAAQLSAWYETSAGVEIAGSRVAPTVFTAGATLTDRVYTIAARKQTSTGEKLVLEWAQYGGTASTRVVLYGATVSR
ncbi:MAG: calcium-binding protein [Patulibacter minatonensis]